MKNFGRKLKLASLYCAVLVVAVSLMRCETDLPGVGGIADVTPPQSGFSFRQDAENQLMVTFTNESQSAVNFQWDFGDGNTSEEADPVNTYSEFDTYTVRLIASDNLGVIDTLIQEIEVLEGPFQPIIFEFGFEDFSPGAGDCNGGEGRSDGRDCWRNSDLGGIIQISTRTDLEPDRNIHNGFQSAKLPGTEESERIGYQLVKVDTAQDYRLSFFYNLEDNKPGGFVTVAVLSGHVESEEEARAATIGSFTGTSQDDPTTFLPATILFNSGDSDEIAIYFFNRQSDVARLDDFTIEIVDAGFIPPSAGFTAERSGGTDFREFQFTNTSSNAANYFWDFGDGSEIVEEENPVYQFPEIDTYNVTLVAQSVFFTTDTFRLDVVVPDPVAASFEFVQDADNFLQIAFTNTSDSAASVLWNFGDGFLSNEDSPTYTYSAEGIYTVTLTATGVSGAISETSMDVVVAEGFIVQVLNGTFDEFTANTGDNADAWDMTPNSTVVDNNGNTIPSPFAALWRNDDLETYLENTFAGGGNVNEQPSSTSNGTFNEDGVKTRGLKFDEITRRLYQLVAVQPNVEYTFSIDTRSETMGVNTEIFILNTEITTEAGIDASKSDPAIDAYFEITNDFNSSSGSAGNNTFTKSTFTFTASTNQIVIYVRSLDAVDTDHEVFLDNITITEN